MYLSKMSLRNTPTLMAIRSTLLPDNRSQRYGVLHKLLYAPFVSYGNTNNSFLWRESGPGGPIYVLSEQSPVPDEHGLLEIVAHKFEPVFEVGQKIRFILRLNATVSTKRPGQASKREDIITRRLREERASIRQLSPERIDQVRQEAVFSWLTQRSADSGFRLDRNEFGLEEHDFLDIPRVDAQPIQFGLVDVAGSVTVLDPALFQRAVERGVGRAKAFGCGLMMVRQDR